MPAPSPLATSPSSSTDNLHGYREDLPPLEPPPLEDSRLYFLNVANGGVIESPPNTPPPLVEAYPTAHHSETHPLVGHPYPPPTHRSLPQIDTSARAYPTGEEYWSNALMFPSPSPSPYLSSGASAYPAPNAQYSSGGLPRYITTSPQSYPHPRVVRRTSHSSAAVAVPVAHSLTARHSIAHLGAHGAEAPCTLQMDDGRVLRHPVAQVASHQLMSRQPQQERYRSTSPSTAYTAPQVAAGEWYAQVGDQRPESPSPPSSQHSSQTPYRPFHESVAVYAPVAAQDPREPQRQYVPIHREAHGAYAAHTSRQQHHYASGYPEAPHQQQPPPYAAYEVVYGAVLPVIQYHTQEPEEEGYDKQQQQPGVPEYMDDTTYTPVVLPAEVPELWRESVGGSTYVAGAETQTAIVSSSSAGAGYILWGGAGQCIQPSAMLPPQVRPDCTPYAPAPAPCLCYPRLQPPIWGAYLAHYEW